MNWLSVPVCMSGAISSYVGLYYLWMFFKRRTDKEQLSFGVTCCFVAIYDFVNAAFYNVHSLVEGIFWQRLVYANLALLSISILWFIYDFVHYKKNKFFYFLVGYCCLILILELFINNEFTLSINIPDIKFIKLGSFNFVYYECKLGIFYKVQYGSMILGYMWILFQIIKTYRSGNKTIQPLLISFIIFFFAAINDILVGLSFYSFIYLLEYAYNIIILSMAYILTNRFVQLHQEVMGLNISLEHKVIERTEELQAALKQLETTNENLINTNIDLKEAHRIATRNMEMAIDVQTSFFPKEAPITDEWDIAFLNKPVAGVSGDFYDFYCENDQLHGISLFDVSGHGIAAGLFTLLAKSIINKNIINKRNIGLGKIIYQVNSDLKVEFKNAYYFLTGILLRLKKDNIEYVNAAHNAILLKRSKNQRVNLVKPTGKQQRGSLLGLEGIDSTFDVVQFNMQHNDSLLLYTDGLEEASNSFEEPYGLMRIISSFESAPNSSASEILNHIIYEHHRFIGKKSPSDDITIIVLKRKI